MRKKKNASEMLHKLQSPIETGFWSTLKQDELLVLCILNTRISEWGKKSNVLKTVSDGLTAPWLATLSILVPFGVGTL